MGLTKYKLGELIKQSDERNDNKYDITHVGSGLSVLFKSIFYIGTSF